jgi:hypothetical protein
VAEVGDTVGVEHVVHERYVDGLQVQFVSVLKVLMVSLQPCRMVLFGDFFNDEPAVNV